MSRAILSQTEHRFHDIGDVMRLLDGARNKTFRELDRTGRGEKAGNKGSLGQIIEESVLGYSINSDPNPDIIAGGKTYELKVTPLRHKKRKSEDVVAKERLVLDIIDYMQLPDETFATSMFWRKSQRIILVYYFDDRVNKQVESRLDCVVYCSVVLDYEDDDLATIRADWETIRQKVSDGFADQLSESDTNYLAACTKGSSSKEMRVAPAPAGSASDTILAKQRAFSYKTSYMTAIADKLLRKSRTYSSLPMSAEQTLEEYIGRCFDQYTSQTLGTILAFPEMANINPAAKQLNSQVVLRMLGTKKSSVLNIEQFRKANVTQVKTAVCYEQGVPEQNMSFRSISEEEWQEWADLSVSFEESFLYKFFEENRFLFVVFHAAGKRREDSSKFDDVFVGGFLWNMPEKDIERYVRPVWERVHELLVSGTHLHYAERGKNLLPGQKFNHVFHLRPKGRTGEDRVLLPNGDSITKQAFWLDRKYVASVVEYKL